VSHPLRRPARNEEAARKRPLAFSDLLTNTDDTNNGRGRNAGHSPADTTDPSRGKQPVGSA